MQAFLDRIIRRIVAQSVGPGFDNFCGICDSNAHVIGIHPPVYDSYRYFANTDYKGRYMKKVLGITLLLAIAATAVAAEDDSAIPTTIAELNATLEAVLNDTNTPGLIGTMVIGDEVIWIGTFGVADRETDRAVTPTTRFRVGYITKSFTSPDLASMRHVLRKQKMLTSTQGNSSAQGRLCLL